MLKFSHSIFFAFENLLFWLCPNLSFSLEWGLSIIAEVKMLLICSESNCLCLSSFRNDSWGSLSTSLPWCPRRPATPGCASLRPLAWAAHFPCAAVQSVRISRYNEFGSITLGWSLICISLEEWKYVDKMASYCFIKLPLPNLTWSNWNLTKPNLIKAWTIYVQSKYWLDRQLLSKKII